MRCIGSTLRIENESLADRHLFSKEVYEYPHIWLLFGDSAYRRGVAALDLGCEHIHLLAVGRSPDASRYHPTMFFSECKAKEYKEEEVLLHSLFF